MRDVEKEFEQFRQAAAGETERLRAETARLAMLVSTQSNAAQVTNPSQSPARLAWFRLAAPPARGLADSDLGLLMAGFATEFES